VGVPVAARASRAIRMPSGPSTVKTPRCGCRPINTISIAEYSKASSVSWGTTAMRRATSRRDRRSSGWVPSRTRPEEGRRVLGFQIDARRYVFETLAQLAVAESAAPTPPEAPSAAPPEVVKAKGLINRVFDAWGSRASK